jgi:hypothetical protein
VLCRSRAYIRQVNAHENRFEDRNTIPGCAGDPDHYTVLADIRDHHAIRLPPAIFLGPGMDANISVRVCCGRMVSVIVVAHNLKHG